MGDTQHLLHSEKHNPVSHGPPLLEHYFIRLRGFISINWASNGRLALAWRAQVLREYAVNLN